jgi:hypothetical protein
MAALIANLVLSFFSAASAALIAYFLDYKLWWLLGICGFCFLFTIIACAQVSSEVSQREQC